MNRARFQSTPTTSGPAQSEALKHTRNAWEGEPDITRLRRRRLSGVKADLTPGRLASASPPWRTQPLPRRQLPGHLFPLDEGGDDRVACHLEDVTSGLLGRITKDALVLIEY